MARRKAEFQTLDPSTWPTVAWTEFDAAERESIRARTTAIEQYARGAPIKEIEQSTGVNRRQLYRLLERALTAHPDGRLCGFRALILHSRVADYVRLSPVKLNGERGSRGAVGALSQLLERFPVLAAWLRLQIKQHCVALIEIRTGGELRTRLRGLQGLHAGFLQQCRQCGLVAVDYPFNTASHAIRSLSARVKSELLSGFGTAARAAGATHLKGLPRSDDFAAPVATRPYQVVEFDGHRLDIRLKVVMLDPLGFTHEFEIERVWLLVIIDVCTRAVLGHHLVLAREYSRYDVIKVIEAVLEPHRAPVLHDSRTRPRSHGWLPVSTHAGARLRDLGAHQARQREGESRDRDTGRLMRVRWLSGRGRTEAQSGSAPLHRAVSSARSPVGCPRVCRATLAAILGICVARCRTQRAICACSCPSTSSKSWFEYAIGSYNGAPHTGLNNVTPLEAMESFVRGKHTLVNWLPEPRRRTLWLMQSAKRCRVHAYLNQGTRPHINLYGVRYSSSVLACSTGLIGKQLLVYLNADDLRSVRAFLLDGTELGVLDAQGAWHVVPHNLTLRQEIRKAQSRKRLRASLDASGIEKYNPRQARASGEKPAEPRPIWRKQLAFWRPRRSFGRRRDRCRHRSPRRSP